MMLSDRPLCGCANINIVDGTAMPHNRLARGLQKPN